MQRPIYGSRKRLAHSMANMETAVRSASRPGIAFIALVFAAALAMAAIALPASAYAAQDSDAHGPKTVKWIQRSGSVYCKVDGKLQKGGIVSVKGKKYLFNKRGIQMNGWQNVGGSYYCFKPGAGAKGYMVTGKVVNGIRLQSNGKAAMNPEARAEMRVLIAAQQFLEKYTKPTWSMGKRLDKSFRVLVYKYNERLWHKFSAARGWARREASDLFFRKSGPCYAYGAGFAYIASAIGYKSCRAVSSGGHGWALIDNKIYDPEWTKHQSIWLYAIPLSRSGSGGVQAYASAGIYQVSINPRTVAIGSSSSNASAASKASVKKPPANKSGWDASKKRYYKKGRMLKGDSAINGKFFAFTSKGLYSSKRTRQLRAACKAEEDIAPLKALIGEPRSSVYQPTCNLIKGMGMGDGSQDGILKYKNFTVYTFKGTDGVERFMGVEAN